MSGGLCSLSTLLFVYPFDTVRVRQSTELGLKSDFKYKKFTRSFGAIRSREGNLCVLLTGLVRGLYSGMGIATLHSFLMAGLTYFINIQLNVIGMPKDFRSY